MICPICNAELFDKERRETTSGTLISVRCTNPNCAYFDYRTIPVDLRVTITGVNS